MNPADIKAVAAEKAWHKDKKQKRKKRMDAIKDDCSAAAAEEGTPHKKKKQRKDGGEWVEKPKRLKPTVSIAVVGSIIGNAQSLELATMVCTPYLLWWTSDYDSCSTIA